MLERVALEKRRRLVADAAGGSTPGELGASQALSQWTDSGWRLETAGTVQIHGAYHFVWTVLVSAPSTCFQSGRLGLFSFRLFHSKCSMRVKTLKRQDGQPNGARGQGPLEGRGSEGWAGRLMYGYLVTSSRTATQMASHMESCSESWGLQSRSVSVPGVAASAGILHRCEGNAGQTAINSHSQPPRHHTTAIITMAGHPPTDT